MKRLFVAMLAIAVGATVISMDAFAKGRLGGGRSVGVQRQAVTPQKPATPPVQQAQPAAAPQPAAPQPAAPSRWLGPLAGLAAGLGLGWLFAQGGFGSAMGAILIALLAGFALMALLRMLSRPRGEQRAVQYAGLGSETVAAPPPSQLPAAERPDYRSQFAPSIPAGFDVENFLKEAKRNFLRLQLANDRGDLQRLREVTTAEMYDELSGEIAARGAPQQTDVVALDAALLEVATEGGAHWASVRFSGSMREEASALPAPFEEIWNLRKPADGTSGWLLAGIQQLN